MIRKPIRIDEDIYEELQRLAREYGMQFDTPNAVLRRALGLADRRLDPSRLAVGGLSPGGPAVTSRVPNPVYTSTSLLTCKHVLGDGSTLVVAADGCSLECKVCHKMVLEVELQAIVLSPATGLSN